MERPSLDQQVTFLHTADLAATAVFYETILQLPLVLDQGSCRIYAAGGDAYLGFCRTLGAHMDARSSDGVMLTLVTQDVDGWHAYLRHHKVPIKKPPTFNEKFNIYQCFVRDPNGYLIEFQRFLDPAWPAPQT